MTTYIALLRGVNVGGHNMVAMQELRKLCERLGLENATTLLQSGNLVFQSASRDASALEARLEQETAKRLGVKPSYFVRTADEWASLVKRNPFREEAERDPGHLLAVLMKHAARRGRDQGAARGDRRSRARGGARPRRVLLLPGRRRPLEAHPEPDREAPGRLGHGPQLEHGAEAARAHPRLITVRGSSKGLSVFFRNQYDWLPPGRDRYGVGDRLLRRLRRRSRFQGLQRWKMKFRDPAKRCRAPVGSSNYSRRDEFRHASEGLWRDHRRVILRVGALKRVYVSG